MKLGLKIKTLRENNNFTQFELAEKSGISRASIQLYEADKVNIPVKNLEKIASVLGVKSDYFLSSNMSSNPSNLKKSQEETNVISIPYFEDTYASAGGGVINYDEAQVIMDFDEEFLRKFLRISGSLAGIHIINARGDSMEPTITNGELLFINPMQNESGIIGGCIYIISYDGDIYVKRVEKNPVTKSITLFSDNDKYEPILIEKHNMQYCHIIGRVVSHMKKA